MKRSEQINEIAAALSKAQAAMGNAIKNSVNPHLKNRYADYTAMLEAIREPFANAGLAVIQEAVTNEKSISITTLLLHASGQWIEFDPLSMPVEKPTAQGVGSAITYGKRYALGAAVGIGSSEDDDANSACGLPSIPKPQASVPAAIPQKVKIEDIEALYNKLPEERQVKVLSYIQREYNAKTIKDLKPVNFDSMKDLLTRGLENAQA